MNETRLKKLVAELSPDKAVLQDVLEKNPRPALMKDVGPRPEKWSSLTDGFLPGRGRRDDDDDASAIRESRRRILVPYVYNPHKRRREIVLPANGIGYIAPIKQGEQQRLVRSIAQGRAWLGEILQGTTTSIIAAREHKSERAIRMMLSLAFLDPKLVKAALHGNLPRGISTKRLIGSPAN